MTENDIKYQILLAQEETMQEVITKIENILKNSQDLIYLTAESALKIVHNNFLSSQNQILNSRHKLMLKMMEKVE